MTQNNIIAQVESLPELIRSQTLELNERVCNIFTKEMSNSIDHIITTGCGDSHMAAIATELAFEQLTKISTEPLNALTASRYAPVSYTHLTLPTILLV